MNVEQVDPDRLSISDLNERKGFDDPEAESGHIEIGKLTESVAEIGIIQPPLVRPFDGEFKDYEVVIGQRRTLAAQEVNNFDEFEDIDEIPVIVVEWDDGDALAASIVENVDAFQEEVGKADRAQAIQRLKNLNKWNDRQVADRLGVSDRTVNAWLEYVRDEWVGTPVHAEHVDEGEGSPANRGFSQEVDEKPTDTVREVRRATGGGDEGVEALETIENEGLSKDDVVEARQRMDENGSESFTESVQEVGEEKRKQKEVERSRRVYIDFTLSGEEADAIKDAAKESAATPKQYARAAIRQRLVDEGYL